MNKSPVQITLTIHLILSIDPTEQYPLAAIAEFITHQNLESTLLEALIERLNEVLVEAYCGEKHACGNGTKRFKRSATSTRSAVTTAGEHDFALDYVKDTAPHDGEPSHFRPIEELIDFEGKKRYQRDISAQSADLATTLSYRDAASHGDGFEKMPSPDTIQRRVKEYGTNLTEYVSQRLYGTKASTVVPDGTKCYSQDDDRDSHEIQITLAEDTDEETRSVLDISVNGDWDEIASSLESTDTITDDAKVVSDAETRLVKAFTDGTRDHQLDLSHVPRTLGYKLWEDGALSLDDRTEIISEVADELFHLKNSVEKHRPEGDRSAIRDRIAERRNGSKRQRGS